MKLELIAQITNGVTLKKRLRQIGFLFLILLFFNGCIGAGTTQAFEDPELYSASFSCADASTVLENTICSNRKLSKLDRHMSEYYFKLKSSLNKEQSTQLLNSQRNWLRGREKQCQTLEASCLIEYYSNRIFELRKKYENLEEYTIVNAQELQGLRNICSFEDITFPEDLRIYAGGAYSGEKTNHQIDQSGHQATQFDVFVNSPEHPVALILGAYEPSIWNISWTKETYIKAVVVTGYHRQAVAGLPNNVPILNSSYDNRGACGYMYVSDKNLKKINPLANKVFGKNVAMVYYAEKGKIVFGEPVHSSDTLYTSKDNPPHSFFDTSKPLAGQAGLHDFVSKHILRRSTANDLERWAKLKEQAYKKTLKAKNEELPPVANAKNPQTLFSPQYVHNGYVILKKMTIPAGLYGAHSATFFLEEGVPYPDGDLGHSTLYDFNTMECHGTICGMH